MPIVVTPSGISSVVNLVQCLKDPLPIEVTLLGISIDKRLSQPEKASSPIAVTSSGMTVFLQPRTNFFVDVSMIALQSPLESNVGLLGLTLIEVRLRQFKNTCSPIESIPLGITIDLRPEQFSKVLSRIFVTLLGMATEVRPILPLKVA